MAEMEENKFDSLVSWCYGDMEAKIVILSSIRDGWSVYSIATLGFEIKSTLFKKGLGIYTPRLKLFLASPSLKVVFIPFVIK